MPLWRAVWAAPAKDEYWSPSSLLEKIAKTNGFRQAEVDEAIVFTAGLSAAEIGGGVRKAIEQARDIYDRLPPSSPDACSSTPRANS
jgi:hypothetical protein